MRGYLSFVLVLASLILVFTLLELSLASNSVDLSKAISAERAYGVQMNVKESIIESAKQGALEGFNTYDSSHDLSLCKHCHDFFCAPQELLPPPNVCDQSLCERCFRESDARIEAEKGAILRVVGLANHNFDNDFDIFISPAVIDSFTAADPASKNGFSLSSLRFKDDLHLRFISKKFGLSTNATVPEGFVISYE